MLPDRELFSPFSLLNETGVRSPEQDEYLVGGSLYKIKGVGLAQEVGERAKRFLGVVVVSFLYLSG